MKARGISTSGLLVVACGAVLSGSSTATIILNQIGDVDAYDFEAAGPTPSQRFPDFASYDCAVLEDFSVDSAQRRITNVSALFQAQGGFVSFQGISGYFVDVFTDVNLAGASLTGDVINMEVYPGSGASVTQVIDPGGNNEYGLVSLDVDILLPAAGNYWISVEPVASLATGQFYLANSGATGAVTPGNANAEFANPAEGFANGKLSDTGADYAYAITAVPEPAVVALWAVGSFAWLCRRRG